MRQARLGAKRRLGSNNYYQRLPLAGRVAGRRCDNGPLFIHPDAIILYAPKGRLIDLVELNQDTPEEDAAFRLSTRMTSPPADARFPAHEDATCLMKKKSSPADLMNHDRGRGADLPGFPRPRISDNRYFIFFRARV